MVSEQITELKKGKLWTFLYIFLQCTWGIIQTMAGFVVFLRYRKCPHNMFGGAVHTTWNRKDGISLGLFLFCPDGKLLPHEYGHTYQSLLLGPLYLLVIGIPSAVWANAPVYVKMRQEKGISYYSFWTEKWADRLGSKMIILK